MKKLQNCFYLVLFILPGILHAQYVSTYFDSTGINFTDDLIFDSEGNLYGADYSGDAIYKIDTNGQVSTFSSGFSAPNGMAFDSMGHMYLCDNLGDKIYKLSSSGTVLNSISVISPSGIIKQEGSDTMIFTTYAGHNLAKLAPDGTVVPWFNGAPLNGPVGLEYDDQGRLYLANFTDRKIFEVTPDSLIYIATVPGVFSASLGFIAYANNSLWGTNFSNHQIYRVFLGYTDSVVLFSGSSFGSVDGPVASAQFYQPNGIVARGDSLFISEYATGKIRLISGISLQAPKYESGQIDVYIAPNPVGEVLNISLGEGQIFGKYAIYHLDGRLIHTAVQKTQKTSISTATLNPGMYVLQIEMQSGAVVQRRFVKL